MATRLYLQSTGAAPFTPAAADGGWERDHGSHAARNMATAKANTPLTTISGVFGSTATSQTRFHTFVSDTLNVAQALAGSVALVIGKCGETSAGGDAHLAHAVRVVDGVTGAHKATLHTRMATSTEFPLIASAATRIQSGVAITGFSASAGDRLVLEIGVHGVTPVDEVMQMRVGDPTGVTDFALTAGLTTDLVPWLEFTQDITFGTPGTTHNADRTESASPADAQTAALTAAGARTEALTAADAQSTTLEAQAARAETLAASDTETGTLTTAAAAADALAAADAETAGWTTPAAQAEALTATDAPAATATWPVARAESLTATDAQDATVGALEEGAVAETLAPVDSSTATTVPAEGEIGPGPIVGGGLPPQRVTVHELVVDGEQKPQRGRVVASLTLVATSAGDQLPQGGADSVRRLAAVVQTAQAVPTGPAAAGYALKSLTARSEGRQARHGGDMVAQLRMMGAADTEQTRAVGAAEADYDLTAREDELLTLMIGMAA